MDKQLDLFGNEHIIIPIKKSGRKRFATMQEIHGTLEGKKCKDCKHRVTVRWSRSYNKCELWRMTNCSSTDIRVNNVACKKFEECDEE